MRFLAALLLPFSLAYASSESTVTPQTTVTLITERESVAPGESMKIGFYFQMKPEWHLYWKNPGDSGLPPRVELDSTPEGSQFSELIFTQPVRIPFKTQMNFGYEKEALFLIDWRIPENARPGESIRIDAKLKWLICKEECLPGKAELSLSLPVVDQQSSKAATGTHESLFKKYIAQIPAPFEGTVRKGEDSTHAQVTLAFHPVDAKVKKIDLLPETEMNYSLFAPPQIVRTGEELQLTFTQKEFKHLTEAAGLLILDGKAHSFRIEDRPAISAKTESGESHSLWVMLVFAFIGGLILNLMPCILPVLSLKALGIVHHAGQRKQEIRGEGWAFTWGVLASFWAFGILIAAFRITGQTLGWGFQLQSPVFVSILSLLFFLMALNLFGFFELGGRIMGVGSSFARLEGKVGSFFTGVLTTIAATPCSAPFMGTALGFALSQPISISILVLTFLGAGLAFPYLLFAYLPNASKILPRPGAWMETFRQFLGFPLIATSIWLWYVLSEQAGFAAVGSTLIALLAITYVIWVLKVKSARTLLMKALAVGTALAAVVTMGYALRDIHSSTHQNKSGGSHTIEGWKPWSMDAMNSALSQKKTVLVNLTADWCVTCKVNEKLVFTRDETKALLKQRQVVTLVGDWTSADPAITSYMEKLGRNSVPVYILYKNGDKSGKILPQLLSVDLLRRELE